MMDSLLADLIILQTEKRWLRDGEKQNCSLRAHTNYREATKAASIKKGVKVRVKMYENFNTCLYAKPQTIYEKNGLKRDEQLSQKQIKCQKLGL